MGPFCYKKRVQNSFHKKTLPIPNACFSSADRKSNSGEGGPETPTQRGSGEDKSRRYRIYSEIFLVPKKNGKLSLIIDLSKLNSFLDL